MFVMNTRSVVIALLMATATLAAQSPDRSKPPAPGSTPALKLPAIQKRQLSNGLPVWLVELHEVPVAQVNLVVLSGAGDDPTDKYGLASLTAAMLTEGAGSRTSLEIADALDFLGADLSASSSFDSAAVRLHVPVGRLAEALPIMADVALRPTFPKEELERLRQQRLVGLLQARDDPPTIASMAFSRTIFGPSHRYGTSTMGTADTIKAFTQDDLRAFYLSAFRPDNAALLVVGDVTAASVLPLDGIAIRRLEAAGSCGRARGAAGSFPARPARGVHRRQAERAANADPDRWGRRAARDTRLLPHSGDEYRAGGVGQLASESQPAREARLHLRRGVDVRRAQVRRSVLGLGWRADGQDEGVAAGILQRAEAFWPVPADELARAKIHRCVSIGFETSGDITTASKRSSYAC